MQACKVRAVVHTQHGCSERTEWYPERSPDATAAMEALVKKQTGIFFVAWEYWDGDGDAGTSSSRSED